MIAFEQPFDYLTRWRNLAPESAMLIELEGATTVEQFVDTSKRFASILRERGVRHGDLVAIHLRGSMSLIATFSVFHEAAVAVGYQRHLFPTNWLGIDWLITNDPIDEFPREKQILVTAETIDLLSQDQPVNQPVRYGSGDEILCISFSSGTTGFPKAIPYTVNQQAARSTETFRYRQSDDHFMTRFGPDRGPGWHEFYASVIHHKHHFVSSTSLNDAEMINRFSIETLAGSPVHLKRLLQRARENDLTFPTLKHIKAGGAKLPRALESELAEFTNATIGSFYGMSEVGRIANRFDIDSDPDFAGVLAESLEIEVFDPETGDTVPEGTVGNLRFRKQGMISGYLKNDAETEKRFRDGWFHSEDRGSLSGNRLYLHGRESEVINLGGPKLDPTAIDALYDQFFDVVECAAFPFHDDAGTPLVGLAVVPARPIDSDEFAKRGSDQLGRFTPRAIFQVDEIPRNEMGKPLRRQLTEEFQAIFDARFSKGQQ